LGVQGHPRDLTSRVLYHIPPIDIASSGLGVQGHPRDLTSRVLYHIPPIDIA